MIEIVSEKRENRLFLQNHLPLHYQPVSNILWFYEDDSILSATFSAFTRTTDTFYKNKR